MALGGIGVEVYERLHGQDSPEAVVVAADYALAIAGAT